MVTYISPLFSSLRPLVMSKSHPSITINMDITWKKWKDSWCKHLKSFFDIRALYICRPASPEEETKIKFKQTAFFFSQNGMFYILDIVLLPIAFLMSLIQSVKCCSNTYLTLVNLNINRWLLFHIDEHKTISIYLYRKWRCHVSTFSKQVNQVMSSSQKISNVWWGMGSASRVQND